MGMVYIIYRSCILIITIWRFLMSNVILNKIYLLWPACLSKNAIED